LSPTVRSRRPRALPRPPPNSQAGLGPRGPFALVSSRPVQFSPREAVFPINRLHRGITPFRPILKREDVWGHGSLTLQDRSETQPPYFLVSQIPRLVTIPPRWNRYVLLPARPTDRPLPREAPSGVSCCCSCSPGKGG